MRAREQSLWDDERWSVNDEEVVGRMFVNFCQQGGSLDFHHPKSGLTLFHRACEEGNPAAIRQLAGMRADIEWAGGMNCRPLVHAVDRAIEAAARNGGAVDWSLVKLLVDVGADAARTDGSGRDLRSYVAGRCSPAQVAEFSRLIPPEAEIPEELSRVEEALWNDERWAVNADEVAARMLEEYSGLGGDLDFVHPRFGHTLFHHACDEGNLAAIRQLVRLGANIDAEGGMNCPPLFYALDSVVDAARQDEHEVDWTLVKLFIELGADQEKTDREGRDFRTWAVGCCSPSEAEEMVRELWPSPGDMRD